MKTRHVAESANSITEGLINLINMHGQYAGRINTVGIYDPRTGRYRRIKESEKGKSDIIACIRGEFWGIEIKFDKDKSSAYQELFRSRVEESGGKYRIVKTWNEALELWNEIKERYQL